MNDTAIMVQIERDEGRKYRVYLDSEGYETVGIGHRCPELHVGDLVSDEHIRTWFDRDYSEAVKGYDSLGLTLDPIRRAVVVMMIFNLGLTRFLGFKKFLGSTVAEDYVMAGFHGLDSRWRKQVKDRAHRMMAAYITGEWIG